MSIDVEAKHLIDSDKKGCRPLDQVMLQSTVCSMGYKINVSNLKEEEISDF